MDTTSNFIDPKNIVSSNVYEIKVDQSFVDNYNLKDLDLSIIEAAVHNNNGQTEFQSKYFVANSQITPYKKVKQSLMELEVRYHAYQEIKASLRKAEIMRLKWLKAQAAIEDPLDKELIQIDIDKNDYDITIWKRKISQAEYEINTFLNIIKEHVSNTTELSKYEGMDEEEEKKYWIARMGKQAAMDIISYGRVGSGNMDSIAMMDSADQTEVLKLAIEYSGIVNAGLHKISNYAQHTVETYLNNGTLNIPELMDSVNTNNANIQLTDKSKTKPESI